MPQTLTEDSTRAGELTASEKCSAFDHVMRELHTPLPEDYARFDNSTPPCPEC